MSKLLNILNKLKFVLSYDFDYEFIVYDIESQQAVKFTRYDDAKAFQLKNRQYLPKIMVGVNKR